MSKPSAFGKETNYQAFVELGKEIGIAKNKKALSQQVKHFVGEDIVASQRAASVLHHVCNTAPELFENYAKELLHVFNHPIHDSGPRVVFRILKRIKISEKHLGSVIDMAFKYLNDVKTPVAIKVNAMYVIANYTEDYPDLISELSTSIRNQYNHQPPAFSACVRKLSKQLHRRLLE